MVPEPVQTGSEASPGELREFLSQHAGALLPASYGAADERVLDHAVERVLAADALVAGRRGGRLCGLAALSRAHVDEEIYGLGMGQLRTFLAGGSHAQAYAAYGALLEAIWQSARDRGIEHLSATVSVDDVAARHSLEAAGFLLMDTRLEYAWRPSLVDRERKSYGFLIRAASDPDEAAEPVRLLTMGASVRLFEPADLSSLQAIAAEAFTERTRTRYTVDPALRKADTGRLYARWVENAASGRFGDLIVVGEADGVPIGFQILRIERELSEAIGVQIGAMGIGAVVPDARGTGVFPALLAEILAWCREQDVQFARGGVLVNNARMHRPCIATGGTVVACQHAFHGRRRIA